MLYTSGQKLIFFYRSSWTAPPNHWVLLSLCGRWLPLAAVLFLEQTGLEIHALRWVKLRQFAYPELSAVVGGQVPDLRGLFLRGHGSQTHAQNNGSTVGITTTTHSSGALGQVQGDALRPITSGGIHHFGSSGGGAFETRGYSDQRGSNGGGSMMTRLDTSRVVPTAEETRPVNMATRFLIRAKP